jgi:hypothetical protein
MTNSQHENSRITVEIIEYVPDSIMHKTVIKKHSGTVNTSSTSIFEEKKSSYDSFLQVVEGSAQIRMNNMDQNLALGEILHVLPNHAYSIHSQDRFKMVLSIVKPE